MSYEKIKKIRITEDKVFITSCSNNVRPHHYYEWEATRLSSILNKQGRETAEKEILFSYFEGMMQPVVNDRYQRAINRIKVELTEDTHEIWKKCGKDSIYREVFLQRLYDNFRNPPQKQPCYLGHQNGSRICRITTYRYWYGSSKPKIFRDPAEATHVLRTNGLDKTGFSVVIL